MINWKNRFQGSVRRYEIFAQLFLSDNPSRQKVSDMNATKNVTQSQMEDAQETMDSTYMHFYILYFVHMLIC